ncbi:MAG: hypothetical protein WDM88_13365 [Galbitalea sp.]
MRRETRDWRERPVVQLGDEGIQLVLLPARVDQERAAALPLDHDAVERIVP